jgi:hypothetical protein
MGQPNPIASYTMGSISEAGHNYVLHVPLDTLEPQMPGTARPGDQATLFVDGQPAENITIGERGVIQVVDLYIGSTDSDDDGMADWWEIKYFGNLDRDGSGDWDNDGLNDLDEFLYDTIPDNPDTDGDGFSDGVEVAANTDPKDPNSYPSARMSWILLLLLDE